MKQTEIGLIPDDWEVNRIGNVSEIFGRIGFRGYTVEDLVDEGFGAITLSPSNIQNGRMDFSNCSYISWKKYDESPEIKIANGDILLVKTGSTYGKSAIVKNLTKKATINPQFVVIKKTKCNNELLGYLIQTPTVQEQIEASIVGGAIPTLSQKQIASFKIPLSKSLAEQQRIAKALSDVDALISTTEKLLQKKQNIKQGTMQNLLTGKKRLPGFGPQTKFPAYKQTELGKIPEDWEVKSFDELFDICTETISVDSIKKESYIGTENMLQDKMGVIKNETELNYLKVREYRKQDILVSNIRPYLKKIWFADKNGGCSTDVLVFRKKRNSDNADFLFKIVSDDRFFNIVNDNAVGTKMPRGDKNIIKQVLFAIPTTKEEQTAIAIVLSSMDKEIETLNTKLEKYRNLKTAMMQQLLTGKIRLVK